MARNVCVVVTARPSYSRVKTALSAIAEHDSLELQLVVAASALLDRYGSVVDEIEKDGFKISHKVQMVLEGESPISMAKTTGLGLMELATAFDSLKPDVVVTIADRYETIATAIAAAYMNIPLAHIQGGEVTGSIDEKVRHAVTKLSDLHLVSTKLAAEYVVRMGESKDAVFTTGCPSIDIARSILDDTQLDFCPFQRYGGVGAPVDLESGYLVVLQHPVTTEHMEAREHVLETLRAVHELNVPTLWFWPNVDAGSDGTSKGIRAFRETHTPQNIHFFKNMSPIDFLKLIYNCSCLIGNSSVGIREASFLGIPSVNIGGRQDGRERGRNTIDVGYDNAEIRSAIEQQMDHGKFDSQSLYGNGQSGTQIADILNKAALDTKKRLNY